MARLERELRGRIGVYAVDTGTGRAFGYRAKERFPFCSTAKLVLAGAVLANRRQPLSTVIHYGRADHLAHSPITDLHVNTGMTVADLCAAAMEYSDNGAANLLIRFVGGPNKVTRFARSIGDQAFRLDRTEPTLNTAIPGDRRDTTTPKAMVHTLRALAVGKGERKALLRKWLVGNTTGDERIRAAVPKGWLVGDKTGTGDYGTANDVAILWSPHYSPILIAVFTTAKNKDAKASSVVVAAAAKLALHALN